MARLKYIFLTLSFISFKILAVEDSSVLDSYVLVGVIIQDSKQVRSSVAVVKDRQSKRSLLMRIGDHLPQRPEWQLKRIERQAVYFANGQKELELYVGGFEDDKTKDNANDDSEKNVIRLEPIATGKTRNEAVETDPIDRSYKPKAYLTNPVVAPQRDYDYKTKFDQVERELRTELENDADDENEEEENLMLDELNELNNELENEENPTAIH